MSPTPAIARLSARQQGYVTRSQMRACGLTEKQIHRRVASEGWTRVLPGVYRMPGVPDTSDGRVMAVHLWMDGNGHFCSTTAGHLMRMDGIARPDAITIARTNAGSPAGWIKVKRLRPDDLPPTRKVNGYRLPTVERLLLELSADLPPRAAGLALDDALRRGMTDLDRLWRMLDEIGGRGRRGTATLERMLRGRDFRDAAVRSAFETAMLRILKRIEGEHIVPDFKIVIAGRTFYVDFYVPAARLGIECQSLRYHGGDDFLDKDMKRHRVLSSLDIEILYFTWDEVMFAPDLVERSVREAIERRRRFFVSM